MARCRIARLLNGTRTYHTLGILKVDILALGNADLASANAFDLDPAHYGLCTGPLGERAPRGPPSVYHMPAARAAQASGFVFFFVGRFVFQVDICARRSTCCPRLRPPRHLTDLVIQVSHSCGPGPISWVNMVHPYLPAAWSAEGCQHPIPAPHDPARAEGNILGAHVGVPYFSGTGR